MEKIQKHQHISETVTTSARSRNSSTVINVSEIINRNDIIIIKNISEIVNKKVFDKAVTVDIAE